MPLPVSSPIPYVPLDLCHLKIILMGYLGLGGSRGEWMLSFYLDRKLIPTVLEASYWITTLELLHIYHHSQLFLVEPCILLPSYHLGEEKGHCNLPYMLFLWQMGKHICLLAWGCFYMWQIMSRSRKLGRAEPLSIQNKA